MFRILKYRKRWKHRMIELIVRDQTIDSEIKYGQKILRKEQDNRNRERTKQKELKGNCKVREKEKKWQKFQVHNRTQKAKREREVTKYRTKKSSSDYFCQNDIKRKIDKFY